MPKRTFSFKFQSVNMFALPETYFFLHNQINFISDRKKDFSLGGTGPLSNCPFESYTGLTVGSILKSIDAQLETLFSVEYNIAVTIHPYWPLDWPE